jgi:MinD-like ATPase involved in chromosome partitioning or flagellar assembly
MVIAVMNKPHCICFISAKGGSGKTVLSASLSCIIAALERPVTIADCDAATNGLTLLHLPQLNRAKEAGAGGPLVGMFDNDGERSSPSSISIAPSLSLVPATFTMASTERVPVENFGRMLDSLLTSLETNSEDDPGYLILDAQAGTDSFAYAAVERADDVVIVSEYDPVSA